MSANKDVEVAGSQSAAAALFLQNAADEAKRGGGENALMSQYWYKLAVQAAQGGNHLYPLA